MLEPKKIIEVFIFHEIDWNSYGLQYIEQFFQLIFFLLFRTAQELFTLISNILKEEAAPSQDLTHSTQEQKDEDKNKKEK